MDFQESIIDEEDEDLIEKATPIDIPEDEIETFTDDDEEDDVDDADEPEEEAENEQADTDEI